MNSAQKGARGERELAEFLRERGIPARRTCQTRGGPDTPDVAADLPGFHVECKRVERLALWPALDQAARDAASLAVPVVFHRPNRRAWIVVLFAEDFLRVAAPRIAAASIEPPPSRPERAAEPRRRRRRRARQLGFEWDSAAPASPEGGSETSGDVQGDRLRNRIHTRALQHSDRKRD